MIITDSRQARHYASGERSPALAHYPDAAVSAAVQVPAALKMIIIQAAPFVLGEDILRLRTATPSAPPQARE
jgi:hypothetical protein